MSNKSAMKEAAQARNFPFPPMILIAAHQFWFSKDSRFELLDKETRFETIAANDASFAV
jgi:hypothetical protein